MRIKKLKSNLQGSNRILCVVELDSKTLGVRVYDKYRECTSVQVDKSKLIKLIDKLRNLKDRSKE